MALPEQYKNSDKKKFTQYFNWYFQSNTAHFTFKTCHQKFKTIFHRCVEFAYNINKMCCGVHCYNFKKLKKLIKIFMY